MTGGYALDAFGEALKLRSYVGAVSMCRKLEMLRPGASYGPELIQAAGATSRSTETRRPTAFKWVEVAD